MSIVEGIGDEVIYVIGVTVILLIVLLAWYSTSVSDHPIFRASVLVIERRRTSPNNSQTNQSHRRVIITTTTTTSTSQQPPSSNENIASGQLASESEQNAPAAVELLSNSANVEVNSSTSSGPNEEKETQLRNRLKPAEVGSQDVQVEQQLPTASETREVDVIADGKIRIRLVFLNDTQRLVEAKLDDRLGQFKQQHFSEELANHRVVRLIYNGQLLQGDQETLQFYGLFDNCVVHCHISSSTVVTPPPQHYSSHTSELDLSRLMLPLFGLVLGLIWCCRMQYRQYFNATSTFALVGITGLFVVSVFSVCVTARNRMQARG